MELSIFRLSEYHNGANQAAKPETFICLKYKSEFFWISMMIIKITFCPIRKKRKPSIMSPPTPAPNFYLHALTQSAEAKYSFFSPHTVSIRYTCFILYTRKNEIFLRKKETLKAIHNIHSFFSTKNIQRVCIWMEELPGCT